MTGNLPKYYTNWTQKPGVSSGLLEIIYVHIHNEALARVKGARAESNDGSLSFQLRKRTRLCLVKPKLKQPRLSTVSAPVHDKLHKHSPPY